VDFGELVERIVAGQWISGPKVDDAIRIIRRFNRYKIRSIINCLGEEYENKELVDGAVDEYLDVIKRIKKDGLLADIAVKPTQIGLLLGTKPFYRNYTRILDVARRNGVFVWFDMEGYQFVSRTIDSYIKLGKSNAGICIQAYLKRSEVDLRRLLKHNATIRLVKGAHRVGGVMFYDDEGTTRNYYALMDYLFKHGKRFTIATHDSKIIEKAIGLNKRYKRDVTFAMLMGIRDNYAEELAKRVKKVSMYVPFGPDWFSYSYRRMKEVSNVKLILRSLFGG